MMRMHTAPILRYIKSLSSAQLQKPRLFSPKMMATGTRKQHLTSGASGDEGFTGCSVLPFWTPGSGHYGNTLGRNTRQMVDSCIPLILQHLDKLQTKSNSVFTMGEYGANDGYSSMNLLASVVNHVRQKRGEDIPMQVIYEDQEKADFNSLFARLSSNDGLMSQFSKLYPFATNINFFKQCVPDSTCDIIFSSFGAHYMEPEGLSFQHAVYHDSHRVSAEESRRFLAKASEDWVKFLQLRAKELKPGGLLIVLNLSRANDYLPLTQGETTEADGNFNKKNKTKECPVSRFGTSNKESHLDLEEIWTQLKDDRVIEEEEYSRCILGLIIRSEKEITAPFLQERGGTVVNAGMSLLHHDQIVHGCLTKDVWQEKLRRDGIDDRTSFAQQLTQCMRPITYSTFMHSLSSRRDVREKGAIMDELYDRFCTLVASKNPADYQCEYILSRLVARKESC